MQRRKFDIQIKPGTNVTGELVEAACKAYWLSERTRAEERGGREITYEWDDQRLPDFLWTECRINMLAALLAVEDQLMGEKHDLVGQNGKGLEEFLIYQSGAGGQARLNAGNGSAHQADPGQGDGS